MFVQLVENFKILNQIERHQIKKKMPRYIQKKYICKTDVERDS